MSYALPDHAAEVLALFGFPDGADCHDDLFWRTDDGAITLFAQCSDTFAWATADAEGIEADDVPTLRQCLADLRGTGQEYLLAELFAARKRGMRPMRLWLYGGGEHKGVPNDKTLPLFEAAGPERDPRSEG